MAMHELSRERDRMSHNVIDVGTPSAERRLPTEENDEN